MEFFSSDQEVIQLGKQAMLLVAYILVVDTIGVVFLHCLQGAGDMVWPATASIASATLVLIGGGVLVILFAPGMGSIGTWAVAAAHITMQSLLITLRWRNGRWTESPAL